MSTNEGLRHLQFDGDDIHMPCLHHTVVFTGVTVILQWCYSCVTEVLQRCYRGVLLVSQ
jgi:hypothetical protein